MSAAKDFQTVCNVLYDIMEKQLKPLKKQLQQISKDHDITIEPGDDFDLALDGITGAINDAGDAVDKLEELVDKHKTTEEKLVLLGADFVELLATSGSNCTGSSWQIMHDLMKQHDLVDDFGDPDHIEFEDLMEAIMRNSTEIVNAWAEATAKELDRR